MTPPAISMARLEMTSLTFMLVCVPLPVCQTRRGKCSSSFPAMTSSAASVISEAFSTESLPRPSFTSAQAFLRMPKRSEEHTSELQSPDHLVCRLLLEKKTKPLSFLSSFFFFNDTATTEIYTLSLHDALPISCRCRFARREEGSARRAFRR